MKKKAVPQQKKTDVFYKQNLISSIHNSRDFSLQGKPRFPN